MAEQRPSSAGHLAEIDEATAPPEIAAIYARIRHLTGAPMTALIWRHIATFPGALAEMWAACGPLYEAGLLQEAAWEGARESVQVAPSGLDDAALARAGLAPIARQTYAQVLDAYNRANPVNFIAVRALTHRLASPALRREPIAGRAWSTPAPVPALPPMVPVAALTLDDRRRIDSLSTDPGVDRSQVVPSLYRHLPPIGPLIALLHADLAPRLATGEIQAQVKVTAAALDARARKFSAMLPPLDRLGSIAGVASTFERFSRLIPEMVVLGVLLRRGLER